MPPGLRLGPYEIVSALGAGGMGEVYKARDTRLDRSVAVKVLPAQLADDPQFRERFDREAKAIGSLTHPHICTLYDVGYQSGTAYLVMEYLEGDTLARRLETGALPPGQALKALVEIASALDHAHRVGIVHRDLKPGNIMLTRTGAKLLDFGLAKATTVVAHANLSVLPTTPANLTAQGTILGTFQYMAPEQLEGQEADARTDIFAFGAVAYEILTGKKAFEGKSQASLLAAIMHIDPVPVLKVDPLAPPLLDRLVTQCLAKAPHERFQSAHDVSIALRWIEESLPAGNVASAPLRRRPLDRIARVASVTLALASIVLGTLYVAQLRSGSRGTAEGPPAVSRLTVVLPESTTVLSAFGLNPLALSPDGQQIVYSSGTPGSNQLYRRFLNRLEVEPIPGTEGAATPFFSFDGQWLAFHVGRTLKKIGANGGLPTTIAEVPFAPSRGATWTRDNVIFYGILGGDLWRVPATGGAASMLTGPDALQREKEITRRFPYAVPNGKTLLYVTLPTSGTSFASGTDFSAAQIVGLDVRTGERKVLLTGGFFPQYAPGGHLVFARDDGLYAVPFDPESLRMRGEAVKVIDGLASFSGNGYANFAVSATGTLVYVPGEDRKDYQRGTTLVWVDRQGRERPLAHWMNTFNQQRLSPDGARLLVHGSNPVSDIGVHDIARGILTRLTLNSAGGTAPIWSPDGTQVTYSKPDPAFTAGPYTLVSRSADGSGTEQALLEQPSPINAESWSPDGKWLAFTEVTPATGSDIWVLSVQSHGTPLAFATSAAAEQHPRFSPDGRWIAYQSNESGRDEVFVRPFPDSSGGKYQVSNSGGVNPEWASGGRELIYQSGTAVMRVTVMAGPTFAAGTPSKLFERPIGGVLLGVSPSSDEFVMSGLNAQATRPAGSTLVVIQNWAEELKRLVPATR
jgi:serine/threonine protein kinase/Tol biopolymer transport system component